MSYSTRRSRVLYGFRDRTHECCISRTAREPCFNCLWHVRGCVKDMRRRSHLPRVRSIRVEKMEKENEAGLNPPQKKRRLSLSRKKPLKEVNISRFGSPTKHEDFQKAAEGVVPTNTRHSTKWTVSTFVSWVEERNKRVPEQIDCDILCCNDPERLSN